MHPVIDGEEIANRLLLALPETALVALRPHCTAEDLSSGQVLHQPRDTIERVYFINRGLISIIKTMRDGRTVEVNVRGIEGVTAPEVIFGLDNAILECMVQVPGRALAIPTQALRLAMGRHPALDKLLQRYVGLSTEQLAQTSACNRLHSLEQRICRWLLVAQDSARTDSFSLTHEFLSMMLGAQRPHLTVTLGLLQRAGLLRYGRGRVTIVDRAGLEATSCECYAEIEAETARLFRLAPPSA